MHTEQLGQMVSYKHVYYDDIIFSTSPTQISIWHRVGGPALIENDGEIGWYLNDSAFFDTKEYLYACGFDEETVVFWLLKYGDTLPTRIEQL